MELTKSVAELTEADQITDEAVLELNLPYSPANERVGDYLRNHNRLGNDYSPLPVLVQEGAIVHTFDLLEFTGADDGQKVFRAKLKRSSQHWLTLANTKYLNTIDLGLFEFTSTRLNINWEEQALYDGGVDAAGYYFPLVHYGGWLQNDSVIVEDFRPWFHLLSILEKGFCEIGWKFSCPFLETDFGRRLIVYLSGKDYGQEGDILETRKFKAYFTADPVFLGNGITYAGKVEYDQEAFDNGNNFDLNTSEFTGAGVFDFHAYAQFDSLDAENDDTQTIQIIRRNLDGTTEVVAEEKYNYVGVLPDGEFFKMQVTAENVLVFPGQRIYVNLAGNFGLFFVNLTSAFWNTPRRILPQRGDILTLGDFINREYTLLQIFKGTVHLLKGKVETNWIDREITLYTSYDSTIFGEAVTGFYQNTRKALAQEIVVDSEVVELAREEKKRYLILQFADAKDKAVERLNRPEEQPLFFKRLDRGSNFDEGIEYSKNPFFEPTLTDQIDKFPVIPPLLFNYDVVAPHLWDNENGELSFDLGPRILYCAGEVEQRAEPDSGPATGVTRRWRYEGNSRTLTPYAFQFSTTKRLNGGFLEPFSHRLVYGEPNEDNLDNPNDLYTMAWRGEIIRQLFTIRSAIKAFVGPQEYQRTNFRDIYAVYYNGRTFAARLLEITRKTCNEEPANLILRPEPFAADAECDEIIVKEPTCTSQPDIDIAISVVNDTIAATANDAGMKQAPITDVWQYSTDDGDTWAAYTPGTPIAGEGEVIFRRTVTFDALCAEAVVSAKAIFETACKNNPTIILDYTAGKNTVIATGGGSFNSTINTDTWQIAIDNGAFSAYTPGTPVTGFTEVEFIRVVTFTNSCEPVEAREKLIVEGEQCNNQPEIVFTEIGAGSCIYDLSIGGTLSSAIFVTEFFISKDNGATFHKWDNRPVKAEPGLEVRAIVHFTGKCEAVTVSATCPT